MVLLILETGQREERSCLSLPCSSHQDRSDYKNDLSQDSLTPLGPPALFFCDINRYYKVYIAVSYFLAILARLM